MIGDMPYIMRMCVVTNSKMGDICFLIDAGVCMFRMTDSKMGDMCLLIEAGVCMFLVTNTCSKMSDMST